MNTMVKWGLDIDGVLCNFHDGFYEYFDKKPEVPDVWEVDFITDNFHKIEQDYEFWNTLSPQSDPRNIDIEIYCYITARPIPSYITFKWLIDNGFPDRPVFTVDHGEDKLEIINHVGVTHFIDDKQTTFEYIKSNSNINMFLFDAPHNQQLQSDLEQYRIHNLSKLKMI